nr:hypothetical protein [Pseudomonas sp. PCH199]
MEPPRSTHRGNPARRRASAICLRCARATDYISGRIRRRQPLSVGRRRPTAADDSSYGRPSHLQLQRLRPHHRRARRTGSHHPL